MRAGDYLETRFPTWRWGAAAKGKERDFLPLDKQYLVTRHVPSYHRVEDYEVAPEEAVGSADTKDGASDSEEWTEMAPKPLDNVPRPTQDLVKEHSDEESSSVVDIDDLMEENVEDDVGYRAPILNPAQRSYDLYISYSTSYRVPKMYLVGFDAAGSPLSPEQMFEDIASDYRHKTVTIEKAPFLSNTTAVSIHPCKHATVMRILMQRAAAAASAAAEAAAHAVNEEKLMTKVAKMGLAEAPSAQETEESWQELESPSGIRSDQYLVVFLKFIASVTPGIEHDYTMEAL